MVKTASLHGTQCVIGRSLEVQPDSRLAKRMGSVWNCLWGHVLKISPGIIRKRRVSYPVPGYLSSATWPKKHYNGLINHSINQKAMAYIQHDNNSLRVNVIVTVHVTVQYCQ